MEQLEQRLAVPERDQSLRYLMNLYDWAGIHYSAEPGVELGLLKESCSLKGDCSVGFG